jgi:hypothetical protein
VCTCLPVTAKYDAKEQYSVPKTGIIPVIKGENHYKHHLEFMEICVVMVSV